MEVAAAAEADRIPAEDVVGPRILAGKQWGTHCDRPAGSSLAVVRHNLAAGGLAVDIRAAGTRRTPALASPWLAVEFHSRVR